MITTNHSQKATASSVCVEIEALEIAASEALDRKSFGELVQAITKAKAELRKIEEQR